MCCLLLEKMGISTNVTKYRRLDTRWYQSSQYSARIIGDATLCTSDRKDRDPGKSSANAAELPAATSAKVAGDYSRS